MFPKPSADPRGLVNEYSCGCQVRHDGAGCYTIHGCPTHNAAPDLLAACKAALPWIEEWMSADDATTRSVNEEIAADLRAAIAKAEPPEGD